ncbi:MAG: DNA alkylation repair protein [Desulfobacteraceae bacterium]|nr:MAG: DNA alkylation repair protein [Desulfobacteraceae bacterium]
MSIEEIQKELAELADPQTALSLQRFFKTAPGEYGAGDLFRGIRVPVLRRLSKEHQRTTLTEAEQLLNSLYHEDRLLALLLLVRLYSRGNEPARSRIYEMYLKNTRFINNWDLVDLSAEHIVGAFLWERERKPLYRLARSSSLWERRIAIMATFHFIKQGDFKETLKLAGVLLHDREDLIHKAVGWMLREIGKRNPRAEEDFLNANCRRMPRVMLRYAIERLPQEKRVQYLKGEV